MFDGRKHHHARVAAVVTAVLTTIGLGFATASPAAAAPDTTDTRRRSGARRPALPAGPAPPSSGMTGRPRSSRGPAASSEGRPRALHQRQRLIDSPARPGRRGRRDPTTPTTGAAGSCRAQHDRRRRPGARRTPRPARQRGPRQRGHRRPRRRAGPVQRADRGTDQAQAALQDQVTTCSPPERAEAATQQKRARGTTPSAEGVATLEASRRPSGSPSMGGPVLAYAKSKVGNAYVYGAAGPSAFDCSGLTMAAWSQAGVSLPHSSSAQYSSGPHISESELQPGDLVFYYSPISHVGMYIGNGQIVNALNPGAGVDLRTARHAVRRCGAPWRLTTRTQSRSPRRGGRLRAVRPSSFARLFAGLTGCDRRGRHRAAQALRRQHRPTTPRRRSRRSTGSSHAVTRRRPAGTRRHGDAGSRAAARLGPRQREGPAGRRPLDALRRRGGAADAGMTRWSSDREPGAARCSSPTATTGSTPLPARLETGVVFVPDGARGPDRRPSVARGRARRCGWPSG